MICWLVIYCEINAQPFITLPFYATKISHTNYSTLKHKEACNKTYMYELLIWFVMTQTKIGNLIVWIKKWSDLAKTETLISNNKICFMNKKATGLKNLSKFSEITLFGCRGENMSKHKTINNFISRQAVNKNMNIQQMMLHENFMTWTRQQKF